MLTAIEAVTAARIALWTSKEIRFGKGFGEVEGRVYPVEPDNIESICKAFTYNALAEIHADLAELTP